MKLKQLSLFLENKPGNLRKACRTLADHGINIETMSLADTEQFGILRILTKDWERAKAISEQNGIVVNVSDVVALAVGHHPGGLADILDVFDKSGLNIEYMYGFSQRIKPDVNKNNIADCAIIVFRFNEPDKAIEILNQRNVQALCSEALLG